jgi:hypothetical protein
MTEEELIRRREYSKRRREDIKKAREARQARFRQRCLCLQSEPKPQRLERTPWNATKQREYDKKRRLANPEKVRERMRRWNAANHDKSRASRSRRRAATFKATPPWLNEEQLKKMSQFYSDAVAMTEFDGEIYHVDHIVPLQGENVCGLHVPWNLQLMTRAGNLLKGNRLLEVSA